MVSQYPYTLWIKTVGVSTKNGAGDLLPGLTTWISWSACRDESNLKGSQIQLADSIALVYDTLIQLPKSCLDVEPNIWIEVRDGATVRVSGTAKRFSRDQLHCRLWV